MIRHSHSFFISLIIHTTIAISLFFIWNNIPSFEKEEEKKIPLKLCCIVEKKPEPKVIMKPKAIPPKPIVKKIKSKPKVKPKPKPKPKPKRKKKKIPKKIIPKKVIPVIKEIVKPQEPVILEDKPKKDEIVKEKVTQKVQEVQEETQQAKETRLEKDYIDKNIQEISRLLQNNLYYPRSARKRGITGEVIVKFKLSKNGIAHSIKVTSANSDILSRAAIKTIENLSGEFPKPKDELILHVPINYKLRR